MRCQEEKQPAASIDGDVWYVADIEEVRPFHWVNRCRTTCTRASERSSSLGTYQIWPYAIPKYVRTMSNAGDYPLNPCHGA